MPCSGRVGIVEIIIAVPLCHNASLAVTQSKLAQRFETNITERLRELRTSGAVEEIKHEL